MRAPSDPMVLRNYEKATSGKLKLFFLPGYAPELKPDELVWSCVKRMATAKRPLGSNQSFQDRIKAGLINLRNNPGLIRSQQERLRRLPEAKHTRSQPSPSGSVEGAPLRPLRERDRF